MQRQDSVTDQLSDLLRLATKNGLYDADWLLAHMRRQSKEMEVIDTFIVRGRGTVTLVDSVPKGLSLGDTVYQGENSWKIISLEMRSADGSVGLILGKAPEYSPEKGTLVWRGM